MRIGDDRAAMRILDHHATRFAAVGVLSTLAYALLYLLLRGPLGAGAANALSLAITAVGNTAANRRLTFGVEGREGLVRQHVMGAAVFALTLGLTSGALALLHAIAARPARAAELAVLLAASVLATLVRYAALRWWVFAQKAEPTPRELPRPSHVGGGR